MFLLGQLKCQMRGKIPAERCHMLQLLTHRYTALLEWWFGREIPGTLQQ